MGQIIDVAGRQPEERVRIPVVRQRWRTMTFLHWRYEPEAVQRVLPDDLTVDTFDGAAWVSLTPFVLADFRLPATPAIPRVSTFPETNLRTYARTADGLDGLWFLTLEVASTATAVALRSILGVPYHVALMQVDEEPPARYRSARRSGATTVGHDIAVDVGMALGPRESSLDHWLAGRWRAFGCVAGRRVAIPVEHEPWELWEAEATVLEESLLGDVGLLPPAGDPIVQFSPGVSVKIGAPRRV